MAHYRLPNVPYTERPVDEPFYIYANSPALFEGRGFARMTPLTRRLSAHLQGTNSDPQPNGYNSITGKIRPPSKPRLMLMGQRR